MKKESDAALLEQDDLKGKISPIILPSYEASVKSHDLKNILALAELSPKSAAELLRSMFPSFDKTVLSKCCKPEKYGCVLHPDGYAVLRNRIANDMEWEQPQETPPAPQERRKSSKHKFTCRVSGRLPDGKYLRLQRYIRLDGYATTQDWVADQVDAYLKKMEAKYGST